MTLLEKVFLYNITMGEDLNDIFDQIIAFGKEKNPAFGDKYEAYKQKQRNLLNAKEELELELDLELEQSSINDKEIEIELDLDLD